MKKWLLAFSILTFFSGDFFALDSLNTRLFDYCKKIPPRSYNEISDLVDYLSMPTKNEMERAEIFLYWIAQNIIYDTHEFQLPKNAPNVVHNLQDSYSVFKTKKAVCAGFANLYSEMCNISRIKNYIIIGYAKGYGYSDGEILQESNHAWNIVNISGKWLLVDPTWVTGYCNDIDNKMTFKRHLSLIEAFADPKHFIQKHLPLDPQWQLLENPIPFQSFFGNKAYDNMEKYKMGLYNFNDTIKEWEAINPYEKKNFKWQTLNSLEQDIKTAQHILWFSSNKTQLAYQYYYTANFLREYPFDTEKCNKAITYYKYAVILFEITDSERFQKIISICKNGTEDCLNSVKKNQIK